jgi:hypothetical protein
MERTRFTLNQKFYTLNSAAAQNQRHMIVDVGAQPEKVVDLLEVPRGT